MKGTWTSWLLAGALAASLQWNLRGDGRGHEGASEASAEVAPASPDAHGSTCDLEGSACELAPRTLRLSEATRRRLVEVCQPACADAEGLEAQASERMTELRDALAGSSLDEASVRELVVEVSRLRRAALDACVDSVLEIRRVLEPEQVARVLTSCLDRPVAIRGGDGCVPLARD